MRSPSYRHHMSGNDRLRTQPPRVVVAVVLTWRGRIGLFKRSATVSGGAGLWHCITGFVDEGLHPAEQALAELREEAGISAVELLALEPCRVLDLRGADGEMWQVHTFKAATERRRLDLNWEHDSYRWVPVRSVPRFDGQVPWLRDVLEAVA
jgi:ADP-ribose pyrophosphatase YjhB (NUDIX family)